MDWAELSSYISGLNADTPLGYIVSIRSEKDKERLKRFTPEQIKIRNEWRNRNASQIDMTTYKQAMDSIKNMFIAMSKKEKVGDKN